MNVILHLIRSGSSAIRSAAQLTYVYILFLQVDLISANRRYLLFFSNQEVGNYEGRSKCFATWYSYAPSPRLRVSLTASACMAATSSSLSLCANMTSSIKPEIRNVSLRRQRIGPSRGIGQVTRINNILVKIGRVFRRYDRGQTNTHRDTHHNIPLPYREGGRSNNCWPGPDVTSY